MANIKFVIDGSVFPPTIKAEVEGMNGVGCTSLLDEAMKIIKMDTKSQTLKPEYKEVRQKLPMRR